jgi:hypothetical protein
LVETIISFVWRINHFVVNKVSWRWKYLFVWDEKLYDDKGA